MATKSNDQVIALTASYQAPVRGGVRTTRTPIVRFSERVQLVSATL